MYKGDTVMKAIGYKKAGELSQVDALIAFEAEKPRLRDQDVLVEVKSISVNPVDVKVRASMEPESGTKVIGYDAAGVVTEIGTAVTKFKVGDEVYYAGDLTRPGTNSEFHAVDERIVGHKPKSLSFSEAAALPLTSITAWEILFDSFRLKETGGAGDTLLIIGGAGGVGSILIQLAKKLTNLTVVATASRPETVEWVKKMGADHVINHRESLADQLKALSLEPKYVASLTGTDQHYPGMIEFIKPRGHITLIDDPESFDIAPAKLKALSISWEFMFTRSMFQTEDIQEQYELLNRVASLVDSGDIVTTLTTNMGEITVNNLRKAHELQESGRAIGKTVLAGF